MENHRPTASFLSHARGVILTWWRRYCARRELQRLAPHILADIGVSDFDTASEAEKPFWKR